MRAFILITVLIYFTIASFSQGLFSIDDKQEKKIIDFTGFGRAVVAGGAENYDLTTTFAELCIKPEMKYDKTYLFADLRFRQANYFNDEKTEIEVKELYGGYQSNFIDFYLGNQIVTWGRADGFNPTNVITPEDYFFLSPEADDQKLSNFMLRSKLRFASNVELDLIGIPFYRPSVYRYDLFLTEDNVEFAEPEFPDKDLEHGMLAGRLNFEYPGIGFSLSYSSGNSPFYGYDVKAIDFGANSINIVNVAKTYRQNALGIDFSIPTKFGILRGEGAYHISNDYNNNIYIPNPDLEYVGAVETRLWEITTIIQYVGKYVIDYGEIEEAVLDDPTSPAAQMIYARDVIFAENELFNRKSFYQEEEFNHALMVSLNRDFNYNTFNVELTGYYNFTSDCYMFRPMLKWKISDYLSAKIGGTYMYGPENSLFAYSSPVLNGIISSMRINF